MFKLLKKYHPDYHEKVTEMLNESNLIIDEILKTILQIKDLDNEKYRIDNLYVFHDNLKTSVIMLGSALSQLQEMAD